MNLIDFKLSKGVKAGIQTEREYINLAIINRYM